MLVNTLTTLTIATGLVTAGVVVLRRTSNRWLAWALVIGATYGTVTVLSNLYRDNIDGTLETFVVNATLSGLAFFYSLLFIIPLCGVTAWSLKRRKHVLGVIGLVLTTYLWFGTFYGVLRLTVWQVARECWSPGHLIDGECRVGDD